MANEIIVDAGIVTVNGTTNTVFISGNTYTGTKYSQGDINTALGNHTTVAAQEVTLSHFEVVSQRKFVGDGTLMSGNTASYYGGAIYTNKGTTVSITGSTFSGNSVGDYGGAIYNSGEMTLKDSVFTGNMAGSGGAIHSDGGTVSITGSTFTDNTATYNGGAIYNYSGSTVSITGSTFSGNTATREGGAIYNNAGSTVSITGSTFSGNSVGDYGGAIYNYSGSATICDSVFSGNMASSGNMTDSGGAIHSDGGTVSIIGSTFTGNLANNNGGAVDNLRTVFSITDSTFSGNTASSGGAIYNNAGSTVSITGSTFTGNSAKLGSAVDNLGGAVYNSGSATICDSVFATATDTIFNTRTLMLGGTIRTAANIRSYNAVTVKSNTKLVLDLSVRTANMGEMLTNYDTMFAASQSNLTISLNVAANQAEGEYVLATGVNKDRIQQNFTVTIDGDAEKSFTISVNDETPCDSYIISLDNGKLALNVRYLTGIVTENGDKNTVVIDGVIYTGEAYSKDNIDQALNKWETVVAQEVSYEKTQLTVNRSDKTFIGDKISMFGNMAGSGGAIHSDGGTVSITGSTFSGNTASSGGGAVYNSGTATITGSTFTGNNGCGAIYHHEDGGAIYNDVGGTVSITGSTFSGNTANYGGAIYNEETATIRDSVFATSSDTIYNHWSLTLEGMVWTAANIRSYNAVTVKENTQLVLDLSVYAGTTSKELLSDFGTMFSESQDNLNISVNVGFAQADGTYVLATDINTLKQQTFTVMVDGNTERSFTISIGGEPKTYESKTYTLSRSYNNEIVLKVRNLTGIVTENGDKNTVVIGEVVYAGEAYSKALINQVLNERETVVAQEVSYEKTRLTVDDSGKTFVGDKISMSGNTAAYYGGAIDNSGEMTLKDSVFTGNMAGSGGAIYSDGGTVSITGSTFSCNTAAYNGGAIDSIGGTASITGSTFTCNTAVNNGGAIHSDGGTVSITGSTFSDNTASDGGAVYNLNSTISITGSTFSDNSAKLGGAIYSDGGTVLITGNTFSGNTANNGGAVFNSGGTVSITGSTFSGNTASDGGAVYNYCGTVSITGSTFTGNTASSGGAICNFGTLTILDSVFATSTDTIYNDGGNLTLGGTITTVANITSTNAVTVEGNTKLVLDLSVYAGTTSKELLSGFSTMFGTSQGNLTISINVAEDQEEGEYVLATGVNTLTQQTFTVTLDGDTERSFTVTVNGETTYNSKNYTLSRNDGTLTLKILNLTGIVTENGDKNTVDIDGVTYTGKAYSQDKIGQALEEKEIIAVQEVSYEETLLIVNNGKTFVGDKISMSGNTTETSGGAIYNNVGGTVSITGSTFSGNTATREGGAIYNNHYSTVSITGSTFSGNTANNGGAIDNHDGTVSITGSTFSGNTAENYGGALYNIGVLFADNALFEQNRADNNGGAFYNVGGTVSITGSTFTGNTAAYDGAAIYNLGSTVSITGSTFTGNTAKNYGGAIYNNLDSSTVSITGSTFTGNTAKNYGGAFYNNDSSTVSITGSTFTGNTAKNNVGGAIYNNGGTATILDSVFATSTDTIYNDGGNLTLGGTITTVANITSTNAVTVESNTKLVLDLSVYAGTTSKELLSGFGTMFDASQDKFAISINIGNEQTTGNYVLATGAGSLKQTEFTITIGGNPQTNFTVSVNNTTYYNFKDYTLSLANGTLSLGIAENTKAIVTANGGTNTVVIDGVTYTGKDYSKNQIGQALEEKEIIAVQEVSYEKTQLTVNSDKTFVGDKNSMSGNSVGEYGGAVYNNNGTVSISGSTFTGNTAANDGGAVYSTGGTVSITGSTFTGNTAVNNGGAFYIDLAIK